MKKFFVLIITLVFCISEIQASHIYGGEFTYEHISGNNYRFNLTLYGDCAGNSTLLSNLLVAQPIISRYNNNVLIDDFSLSLVPGSGIEVTPVCPAQLNNTICASTSGTVPGVRQYKYTGTKNLGSASANWKFMFWGELNINNNKTGRSNSITNINPTTCGTGGNASVMSFEATLNNLAAPNSAVNYTTIPTPFHCNNKVQSFNPGAVDPDGDLLGFTLVQGIDGNSTTIPISCFVSYITPQSALDPLIYVPGSFSFSATTGQLNYEPNFLQKALVVMKVSETRNGIVVGTTMREMTFVVLPCVNTPPGGSFTNTNNGFIDSLTNIYVCQNAPNLVFTIPVVDPDGNNINITSAGLPAGCTLSIAGNNTSAPTITGTWVPSGGFVPGNYTFFVTYLDDACPLSSKQTIAYTIHVLPAPNLTTTNTQPTCANGLVGSLLITASGGTPNYQYTINTTYGSSNSFSNIAPGTYVAMVKDANNCIGSTSVSFVPPPLPAITNVIKTTASCAPGCDASMTIIANSPSSSVLTYSVNNGANFQSSNIFINNCVGTYTIWVKDANNCTTSSIVTILNPSSPTAVAPTPTTASCAPGCDATITGVSGVPAGVYTFKLNAGLYQSSTTFNGLCVGIYTLTVKDINSCTGSTIFTVVNPAAPNITGLLNTPASCSPGCDGIISNISATSVSGATFTYSKNGGAFQASSTFNGLCVGNYTITVKDAAGCTNTTVVTIGLPPGPTWNSITANTASCAPGCDGTFTNISASSGAGGITYNLNGGAYQTGNSFTGLCVGAYTIFAKDANGCTSSTLANIVVQPDPQINSLAIQKASCVPGCDGTITVNASSNLTLNYNKNGGVFQTASTFNALCVGSYTIVVKDSKNCTASSVGAVQRESDPVITSFSSSDITCNGNGDGKINITATGTGIITYILTPTNATNGTGTFTNLQSNNYNVLVVDSKGCTTDKAFVIVEPGVLAFDIVKKDDKTCEFKNNGSIEVIVKGGTNPITFNLNNGTTINNTGLFLGLNSGTYSVVVIDANNCSINTVVTILPPMNPMKISTSYFEIPCDGSSTDGWAEVTATAGTAPYAYSWNTDPARNTARIDNLFAGNFVITVVDAKGCELKDTVVLRDPSYCCTNIFIPNAFSPNGDGVNDKLQVITKTTIENPILQIYNRWGNKVFETQNIEDSWTGEHGQKGTADLDVYFYMLKYKCRVNNKDYLKKGDVLLVR
jgi:gliding motility-associated-like protein